MSELIPPLKRLLQWARRAPAAPSPSIPLGFAGRVVAHWRAGPADGGCVPWLRAVQVSAWASSLLILCGTLWFVRQRPAAVPAYDFTVVYQVAAGEFMP